MADNRTKRQKLEAMANQSVSPEEAAIAKTKLENLGEEETPKVRNIIYVNGIRVDMPTEFTITFDWSSFNQSEYPVSSGNPYMGFKRQPFEVVFTAAMTSSRKR